MGTVVAVTEEGVTVVADAAEEAATAVEDYRTRCLRPVSRNTTSADEHSEGL